MTKADIIDQVIRNTGMLKSSVEEVVSQTIKIMADTLAEGNDNIYLRGLGTFKIRQAAPKPARNITTGETVLIPAHKTVKFIPGKAIKQAHDAGATPALEIAKPNDNG